MLACSEYNSKILNLAHLISWSSDIKDHLNTAPGYWRETDIWKYVLRINCLIYTLFIYFFLQFADKNIH